MRTLAIGDIHGCLRALDGVLEMVRPEADDVLVFLGDYVDRGPNSRGVIDRLIELASRCRCVFLRGNHDQMMLDARTAGGCALDWPVFGGRQTLESYATDGHPGTIDGVPDAHWQFLDMTQAYHETDTHFFVHGNVDPNLPLAEQQLYTLYWEKLSGRWSVPHCSGKIMVCGHTAQKAGAPLDLGHAVCIDTFVYGSGWLTCLDVHSGRLWQARQTGESCTGWLGESREEVE
jgi:serine/threonine protein phosphatase 1